MSKQEVEIWFNGLSESTRQFIIEKYNIQGIDHDRLFKIMMLSKEREQFNKEHHYPIVMLIIGLLGIGFILFNILKLKA